MRTHRNKAALKDFRSTLTELRYFNFTGDLSVNHGQFNNSLPTLSESKRNLDK